MILIVIELKIVTKKNMSEKEEDAQSRAGSDISEEEKKPAPYIPKNPMIRPEDVKIS